MKAVIFDMDGTLTDSMYIWRDFHNRVIKRLNIKTYPENIFEMVNNMSIDESAEYFAKLSKSKSMEEIKEVYFDILKDFYQKEVELKPNVKEFLEALYKKNIIMCVATETDILLAKMALERTGILKYFKFCICSKEVGKGKKYPDIFFEALKRLEMNMEDVIIFEDAYYAALTAKEAGFIVYAIHDDFHKNPEEIINISDKYMKDYIEYLKIL